MSNTIQFLGRHPNGSFFITKDAQKIAQAVADEDGFSYWEFSEKNGVVSLMLLKPETGAEVPPPDLEIKNVIVGGKHIRVSTLTPKAKKAANIKIEQEKEKQEEIARKKTAFLKKRADEQVAEENARVAEAAGDKKAREDGEAQATKDAEKNG